MNTVPCPGRIVIDLGDGFSTGCALGAIWYFIKGSYYAVRRERMKGGLMLLRSRAPILGGSFAMWACVFSISSCIMVYIRQREDPFNSVVAGFSTGFILAIRGGFRNAMRSAIIGGLFLSIIESMMVMHSQYQKRKQIIEQNKMINNYRKELEKTQGLKFKERLRNNPYVDRSKSAKANLISNDEVVINDPAKKMI